MTALANIGLSGQRATGVSVPCCPEYSSTEYPPNVRFAAGPLLSIGSGLGVLQPSPSTMGNDALLSTGQTATGRPYVDVKVKLY